MPGLVRHLMDGVAVLQSVGTEKMAQRFWGYHIRVLIENLVDSGCRQLFALPADEEKGAVGVAFLQILPQGMNNFVIDVDQPLFVTDRKSVV